MTTKTRRPMTSVVINDIPQDYIKAKYLRATGRPISMAGFEAGEPEVKLITNVRTGKRQMRLTLNGFIHIQPDGSVLILNTLHNRLKLRALCQDLKQTVPLDSKGEESKVVSKGPDFEVEDESIFDGLDEEAAIASKTTAASAPAPKRGRPPMKPKGLVPVSAVKPNEAGPKPDNADGVGGTETGRRPEEVSLDIE